MPNKDGTDHILGKEENMKYSAAHYVKMQAALLWYIGYKMTKKKLYCDAHTTQQD